MRKKRVTAAVLLTGGVTALFTSSLAGAANNDGGQTTKSAVTNLFEQEGTTNSILKSMARGFEVAAFYVVYCVNRLVNWKKDKLQERCLYIKIYGFEEYEKKYENDNDNELLKKRLYREVYGYKEYIAKYKDDDWWTLYEKLYQNEPDEISEEESKYVKLLEKFFYRRDNGYKAYITKYKDDDWWKLYEELCKNGNSQLSVGELLYVACELQKELDEELLVNGKNDNAKRKLRDTMLELLSKNEECKRLFNGNMAPDDVMKNILNCMKEEGGEVLLELFGEKYPIRHALIAFQQLSFFLYDEDHGEKSYELHNDIALLLQFLDDGGLKLMLSYGAYAETDTVPVEILPWAEKNVKGRISSELYKSRIKKCLEINKKYAEALEDYKVNKRNENLEHYGQEKEDYIHNMLTNNNIKIQ